MTLFEVRNSEPRLVRLLGWKKWATRFWHHPPSVPGSLMD